MRRRLLLLSQCIYPSSGHQWDKRSVSNISDCSWGKERCIVREATPCPKREYSEGLALQTVELSSKDTYIYLSKYFPKNMGFYSSRAILKIL